MHLAICVNGSGPAHCSRVSKVHLIFPCVRSPGCFLEKFVYLNQLVDESLCYADVVHHQISLCARRAKTKADDGLVGNVEVRDLVQRLDVWAVDTVRRQCIQQLICDVSRRDVVRDADEGFQSGTDADDRSRSAGDTLKQCNLFNLCRF